MEPYYKLMWHNAGVGILDDEALTVVINDYREKDKAAYGGTTAENVDNTVEATRMIALAKHISALDAKVLKVIFGSAVKVVMSAIELDLLSPMLVEQGEANFNLMFTMHGSVEGVLNMKESPFASRIAKESFHPVGHEDNPELIVLDLARLGMAVEDAADSCLRGSSSLVGSIAM